MHQERVAKGFSLRCVNGGAKVAGQIIGVAANKRDDTSAAKTLPRPRVTIAAANVQLKKLGKSEDAYVETYRNS
jgi:hypothetical protein